MATERPRWRIPLALSLLLALAGVGLILTAVNAGRAHEAASGVEARVAAAEERARIAEEAIAADRERIARLVAELAEERRRRVLLEAEVARLKAVPPVEGQADRRRRAGPATIRPMPTQEPDPTSTSTPVPSPTPTEEPTTANPLPTRPTIAPPPTP